MKKMCWLMKFHLCVHRDLYSCVFVTKKTFIDANVRSSYLTLNFSTPFSFIRRSSIITIVATCIASSVRISRRHLWGEMLNSIPLRKNFNHIHFTPRCVTQTVCIFLVACYATLHPALSVRRLVHPSHFTFSLFFFCVFWPHCSCPNDQVTYNTAPAHPHATGVAVYPALLMWLLFPFVLWLSVLLLWVKISFLLWLSVLLSWVKIRPDARLPRSRAGGQGPYCR